MVVVESGYTVILVLFENIWLRFSLPHQYKGAELNFNCSTHTIKNTTKQSCCYLRQIRYTEHCISSFHRHYVFVRKCTEAQKGREDLNLISICETVLCMSRSLKKTHFHQWENKKVFVFLSLTRYWRITAWVQTSSWDGWSSLMGRSSTRKIKRRGSRAVTAIL